jgi:hypothetical protein
LDENNFCPPDVIRGRQITEDIDVVKEAGKTRQAAEEANRAWDQGQMGEG